MKLLALMTSNPTEPSFLKKLFSNRSGMMGVGILAFLAVVAAFSWRIAPYTPYAIVADPYLPPSVTHAFGTDGLGRDIFSQMVYGAGVSLEVGFISALGITILGTVVGLVAGYYGSYVDQVLMRLVDVLLVIPATVFMIFVALILGSTLSSVLVVIIAFGWPPMARMIRSQTLTLKHRGFVESAVVSGAPKWYVLTKVILPNVTSLILANGILAVIYSIIAEASLSFLGLVSSTNYSWGTVLNNAQVEGAVYHNGILWITVPGLAIAVTGIAMTLIARAIGDITDPKYST